MGKYGESTIEATKMIRDSGINPCEAWEESCGKQFLDPRKCARGAYLGLCEEGMIREVPLGRYTNSEYNKRYAVEAVKLLRSSPSLAQSKKRELWRKVLKNSRVEAQISENSQLDVVLTLWNNGFIEKISLVDKPIATNSEKDFSDVIF